MQPGVLMLAVAKFHQNRFWEIKKSKINSLPKTHFYNPPINVSLKSTVNVNVCMHLSCSQYACQYLKTSLKVRKRPMSFWCFDFSVRCKYCVVPCPSGTFLAVLWLLKGFFKNPSSSAQQIEISNHVSSSWTEEYKQMLASCPHAAHLIAWGQGVNLDQVSLNPPSTCLIDLKCQLYKAEASSLLTPV